LSCGLAASLAAESSFFALVGSDPSNIPESFSLFDTLVSEPAEVIVLSLSFITDVADPEPDVAAFDDVVAEADDAAASSVFCLINVAFAAKIQLQIITYFN
jgi:hypothetical protein